MTEIFAVPDRVIDHIRRAFSHVNDNVSRRLSSTPNLPEESLDIAFIEALSDFAGPTQIDREWAVRIAAHFIGNIRHYRRYEIADIGAVVVFKRLSRVVGRKLVLLQSKRLYPLNHRVEELDDFDYELGLAKVTRGDRDEASIFSTVAYKFTEESVYGAMKPASRQCKAIADHFGQTTIPVHYMLYNPVVLPWEISYPLSSRLTPMPARELGTRVIESAALHRAMSTMGHAGSPSILDLMGGRPAASSELGLPLELFFEAVVRCREGYRFSEDRDQGIHELFSRKSGPIFCIVEITIETSREQVH